MIHSLLLLLCLAGSRMTTFSANLPPPAPPSAALQPPDMIHFHDTDQEENIKTTPVKRHAPWLGYIPIVCLPTPVVEVRYIVNVQAPDGRCFPQPPVRGPSVNATTAPSTTDTPDLISRFGDTTTPTTPSKRPNEPSRCVWAIVACCSPGSTQIRYPCFELLGCQGAFWDTNPCDPAVVQAAANTALQFYMTNMNATETNTIEPDNL